MKTIKYVAIKSAILLFSILFTQQSFSQINVRVGVGRPRHERAPFKIINSYNRPRDFYNSPSYGYNPHRYAPSYRRNSYYNTNLYNNYSRPLVVNKYYYGGGYHPYPSYYRPFSSPSFGISINVLPRGYYPFYVGQNRYFYNEGLYYQPYQGYYQTIAPPLGALVPSLPSGASSVFINNETYYEFNGTYYQRSFNGPGRYEVVGVNGVLKTDVEGDRNNDNNNGKNNNQPITSLPENFKTIVLDNKVYYVTPSGEYYTKNIDENGNVTFSIEAK